MGCILCFFFGGFFFSKIKMNNLPCGETFASLWRNRAVLWGQTSESLKNCFITLAVISGDDRANTGEGVR